VCPAQAASSRLNDPEAGWSHVETERHPAARGKGTKPKVYYLEERRRRSL